jgi:hypothetical protein
MIQVSSCALAEWDSNNRKPAMNHCRHLLNKAQLKPAKVRHTGRAAAQEILSGVEPAVGSSSLAARCRAGLMITPYGV